MNAWYALPVVIVGCGPSLTPEQCGYVSRARRLMKCRVIAVNNSYEMVDWLDVVYAGDMHWWRQHEKAVRKYHPQADRWSSDAGVQHYGGFFAPADNGVGLADETVGQIRRGTSSGFQAVGLAVQWRAKHIVLIGCDCQFAPDGRQHYFGDHPVANRITPPVEQWAVEFDSLAEPCAARGIRLAQCSLDTATVKLIRSRLEDEL